MNFELTDEQKAIKKAAWEFAEGMFPEVAEECDLNETFPRALWKKACGLGFVGVFIDEAYGGRAWALWRISSSWRSSAGSMQVAQVFC